MQDVAAEKEVRMWRVCIIWKTETPDVALERKRTLDGGCENALQVRKVREWHLQSLQKRNTPCEHQPRETVMDY